MRRSWSVISWAALAASAMLVSGGAFGVWVIERDRGADDPWLVAAKELLDEPSPSPGLRLGNRSIVLGCGLFIIAIPGAITSLRKPAASSLP